MRKSAHGEYPVQGLVGFVGISGTGGFWPSFPCIWSMVVRTSCRWLVLRCHLCGGTASKEKGDMWVLLGLLGKVERRRSYWGQVPERCGLQQERYLQCAQLLRGQRHRRLERWCVTLDSFFLQLQAETLWCHHFDRTSVGHFTAEAGCHFDSFCHAGAFVGHLSGIPGVNSQQ